MAESNASIIENLKLNLPHQFKFLQNPSAHEVLTAIRRTSHHILIDSSTDFEHLFTTSGWKLLPMEQLGPTQRFYYTTSHRPTDWTELWGYFNFHEFYENIADWVRPNGRVMEVGTNWGRSIAYLARKIQERNKQCEVFGVDPFPNFYDGTNVFPPPNYRDVAAGFKSMGLGHINLMPMSSQDAHKHFPNEYFDFIYIDANHNYKHVHADIGYWLPKLVPGGVLAGHDYDKELFAGCCQAVDELIPAKHLTIMKDVWIYDHPG